MIKCVVTDIDGTLMHANCISNRNYEALKMLRDAGIEIILATGRDQDAVYLFDGIECDAIINNGAGFVDHTGRYVFDAPISFPAINEILNIITRFKSGVILYSDKISYSFHRKEMEIGFHNSFSSYFGRDDTQGFYLNTVEVQDASELINRKIYKAELMNVDRQDEIEMIRDQLRKLSGINVTSSMCGNIEVNDILAEKGYALQKVMKIKNYGKDEVAVFGDGENDIGMIRAVTHSFAVENAVNELKECAAYQLPSCQQDGFYHGVLQILEMNYDRS